LHTKFWWGNIKERDHLEDLGAGRVVIINYNNIGLREVVCKMGQYKDTWRLVGKAVMHLNFSTRCDTVIFPTRALFYGVGRCLVTLFWVIAPCVVIRMFRPFGGL
jgi:hypothetical protein